MSNIRTQIRRDPAATWTAADITLAAGEMACESDTGKIKVGDGTNKWTKLDYAGTTIALPWGGASYGFILGGDTPQGHYPGGSNNIQRYSFASDGNATDYKDLSATNMYASSVSDTNNGNVYSAGHSMGTTVGKWSISNATTAATGAVTTSTSKEGSATAFSKVHGTGYFAGGGNWLGQNAAHIDKFTTASEGSCSDQGDLLDAHLGRTGPAAYSLESAYTTGAYPGASAGTTKINKWNFATDGDATDVGNLGPASRAAGYSTQGSFGPTHGFFTGGGAAGGGGNEIQTFPFASEGTTIDGGTLYQHSKMGSGGATSTTHGYVAGGYTTDNIQKFPTAGGSGITGTDVGNLVYAGWHYAGAHG